METLKVMTLMCSIMYAKYIAILKLTALLFGWESSFMNSLFDSNQKVYDTNGAIAQARESRFHQGPNSNERLNHMIRNHV